MSINALGGKTVQTSCDLNIFLNSHLHFFMQMKLINCQAPIFNFFYTII